MKRLNFFTGILVGIGISASTAAFASNTIQAVLFPSKVTLHMNGETKEINVTDNDPVINYKNKTYIPLRLFAESMGAIVDYQAPSQTTGNLHAIDIRMYDDSDLGLQDPEGYIRAGQLEENIGEKSVTLHGILKIDKKLDGKAIQIDALDKDKKMIGSSGAISIDGPKRLAEGDVRRFHAYVEVKGKPDSYQFKITDWALTRIDFHDGMLLEDAGIVFGPAQTDAGNKTLVFNLHFKNQGDRDITIKPLDIELQILKVNGNEEQLIFSYKLPTLQGTVPAKSWMTPYLPVWDLKDKNGNPITGKYAVRILIPESLEYTAEGDTEVKTIRGLSRITRWEYEITPEQVRFQPGTRN